MGKVTVKSSPACSKVKRTDKQLVVLPEDDDVEMSGNSVVRSECEDDADVVEDGGHFLVKCVPKRIIGVIEKLGTEQRKAVKEIGFGGLFHLNFGRFPRNILPLFLKDFESNSFMFKVCDSIKFLLTKDDVCDCFQLPSGPNDLPLLGTARSSESSQQDAINLKQHWRRKFKVSKGADGVPFGLVLTRLTELSDTDDNGDEFKKLFVLFSMGTFLAPTSNNKIDFKLLKAVEDVRCINSFDWCKYIFDKLVKGCSESSSHKRALTGCLPILYVAYFHRFAFRGVEMPSTLPLIQHWDYEKMAERAKAEVATGSLGNAPMSNVKYPICRSSSSCPAIDKGKGDCVFSSVKQPSARKFIQLDLPDGVEDDAELEAIAIDDAHLFYLKIKRLSEVFCSSYLELTTALNQLLSDRAAVLATADSPVAVQMTPTQAFFADPELHKYVDEVIRIANYMKQTARNIPSFECLSQIMGKVQGGQSAQFDENVNCNDTICTPDLNPDSLIGSVLKDLVSGDANNEQVFVEEESEVVPQEKKSKDVVFEKKKKKVVKITLKKKKEQEVVKKKQQGNVKGKEKVNEEDIDVVHDKEDEVVVEKEQGNLKDTEVVYEKEKEIQQGIVKEVEKEGQQEKKKNDIVCASHHPYLLHSAKPQSCMVIVPEDMGCTCPCGQPDPKQAVVSEFIRDNIDLFAPVFNLRKDVIDYGFTFDHTFSPLEDFVRYGELYFITREDLKSVVPGKEILNVVIDCWCILLNELGSSGRAALKTSRCFFGLNYCDSLQKYIKAPKKASKDALFKEVFGAWDFWLEITSGKLVLDSDMVFLPMLDHQAGHFSCVCINFMSKKLEYLDNRSYEEPLADINCGVAARISADLMGQFLVSKGIDKGKEVSGFELVNIPFSWQSTDVNEDCGVFVMLHMLFYCGLPFECNLGNCETRKLYRAEIVACLVFSDMNKVRAEILSNIPRFKQLKPLILPELLEKREEAKREKAKREEEKRVEAKLQETYPEAASKDLFEVKFAQPTSRPKIPVKRKSVGNSSSKKKKVQRTMSPRSPITSSRKSDANSPSSVLGSRRRGQSDGLGCSLDCGQADSSALVVSTFMRSNQALFAPVLSLRKEVSDYIFLDDQGIDENLVLFSHGPSKCLTKKELMSLHPHQYMSLNVVECWALLLNELEFQEPSDHSMLFFGITHSHFMEDLLKADEGGSQLDTQLDKVVAVWNFFLSKSVHECSLQVDLIFIPMLLDFHFFCVCIDFKEERIKVLDNKLYTDSEWEGTLVYRLSRLVADGMSDFLEGKHEDATAIVAFEIVQEKFKWQKAEDNDKESGLFLLMHMLCYEGKSIELDNLVNKTSRRLVVLEIAVALVLADINNDREKVLVIVEKFKNDKAGIWKNLDAQRRLNAILEKKGITIPKRAAQTEVPVLRDPVIPYPQGRGRGRVQVRGSGRGRGQG